MPYFAQVFILSLFLISAVNSYPTSAEESNENSDEGVPDCHDGLDGGLLKCVVPEVMDYVAVGQQAALAKFISESLEVPCNKIQKIKGCLSKDFSSCSYFDVFLGDDDAFEIDPSITAGLSEAKFDAFVDMTIDYVCVKEIEIFNKAKTCLVTKGQDISKKFEDNNCKQYDTGAQPSANNACKAENDPGLACVVKSIADVCGKDVADRIKTYAVKAANLVYDCNGLHASAFTLFRRTLSLLR